MSRPRRFLAAPLVLLAVAVAAPARDKTMPAFPPELQPFAGTWKLPYKYKKEKVPLYMVIKEEKGELRLRYQVPYKDKVNTGDWYGDITVQMQVYIEEKRDRTFVVKTDPPSIIVTEHIHYTDTQSKEVFIESVYEVTPEDKLKVRCVSVKRGKEDVPCPEPMYYERVSKETTWPKDAD